MRTDINSVPGVTLRIIHYKRVLSKSNNMNRKKRAKTKLEYYTKRLAMMKLLNLVTPDETK